jgi:hypothetical protein
VPLPDLSRCSKLRQAYALSAGDSTAFRIGYDQAPPHAGIKIVGDSALKLVTVHVVDKGSTLYDAPPK